MVKTTIQTTDPTTGEILLRGKQLALVELAAKSLEEELAGLKLFEINAMWFSVADEPAAVSFELQMRDVQLVGKEYPFELIQNKDCLLTQLRDDVNRFAKIVFEDSVKKADRFRTEIAELLKAGV